MTYSASWNGKCRDFPGLPGLVSPPISTLTDAEAEHVDHTDYLVDHYLDEHREYDASLSISGSVGDDGKLGLNINIALAPVPAEPIETETPAADASAEQTPATATVTEPAPEAEQATSTEATQETAAAAPTETAAVPSGEQPAPGATA
ncbi:MAG: hypothetical protein WAU42_04065 [Solirubrobacteraceae bacterium]